MDINENFPPISQSGSGGKSQIREETPRHYYGDVTRRLFVAGGIIVLVGMPLFADYLKEMVALSALGVIIIALIAGFANPRSRNVQILLLLASAAAVLFFEPYAAYLYTTLPLEGRGLLSTHQKTTGLPVVEWFSVRDSAPRSSLQGLTVTEGYHGLARGASFVAATQILAIIFFLALYFSAKTVRGMSPRAR